MALLAMGQFGQLEIRQGAPVDLPLISQILFIALLGCLLTAVQWVAGAGVVAWFSGKETSSLSRSMLLGFPFSLIIMAAWSYLMLALPYGWIFANAGLISCLLPFLRHPPARHEIRRLAQLMLLLIPPAVLLGCWMGFLAHGPTATVPGHSSGDVSFYASSVYSIQRQPFPFLNYANEGEVVSSFNMLHSMLGAALMQIFPLDPFQFVPAAGMAMFVFGLGLAFHAYLSIQPRGGSSLSYAILVLAAVVANRYPYWAVESPPFIFTLPLTVSICYRATTDREIAAASVNASMAIVGSALSKVTSILTLGPLSFAPVLGHAGQAMQQFRKLSWMLQATLGAAAIAGAVYAVYMAIRFGPFVLAQGGIGPETYERYLWAIQYHVQRRAILPYLLRDVGTVLLGILALRILSWPFAAALLCGLIAALMFPYFARVNLYCAAIAIALAGVDRPDLLQKSRTLAVMAFLLCLPAIFEIDVGGRPSGVVWSLCIGCMAVAVCAQAGCRQPTSIFTPRFAGRCITMLTVAGLLGLMAVAQRYVAFTAQRDPYMVPTEARDVWTAVRERTPAGALIFTDQTGVQPYDALGGWNTYATTGQRQIYLAGWYQSPELRQSPQFLTERLKLNDAVLSGQMQPVDLHFRRGPYSAYFAVVSRKRPMPSAWRKAYENRVYVLYRYAPEEPAS